MIVIYPKQAMPSQKNYTKPNERTMSACNSNEHILNKLPIRLMI